MSHEGSPQPIINPDGSVNQGIFAERGIKLNLDQAISHQIGDKQFNGTVGEMFASCPYIGEMVNQAHINGGTDAAITALQFVGMTARVEIVSPIKNEPQVADEITGDSQAVVDVKKNKQNQVFPTL